MKLFRYFGNNIPDKLYKRLLNNNKQCNYNECSRNYIEPRCSLSCSCNPLGRWPDKLGEK